MSTVARPVDQGRVIDEGPRQIDEKSAAQVRRSAIRSGVEHSDQGPTQSLWRAPVDLRQMRLGGHLRVNATHASPVAVGLHRLHAWKDTELGSSLPRSQRNDPDLPARIQPIASGSEHSGIDAPGKRDERVRGLWRRDRRRRCDQRRNRNPTVMKSVMITTTNTAARTSCKNPSRRGSAITIA